MQYDNLDRYIVTVISGKQEVIYRNQSEEAETKWTPIWEYQKFSLTLTYPHSWSLPSPPDLLTFDDMKDTSRPNKRTLLIYISKARQKIEQFPSKPTNFPNASSTFKNIFTVETIYRWKTKVHSEDFAYAIRIMRINSWWVRANMLMWSILRDGQRSISKQVAPTPHGLT